jgi:FixJ family two-component response regulator
MPSDELVEKIESGSLRPQISPTGDRAQLRTAITGLHDRERQVLTWLAEGLDDNEIVVRLWIPVKSLRRDRAVLIEHLREEESLRARAERPLFTIRFRSGRI